MKLNRYTFLLFFVMLLCVLGISFVFPSVHMDQTETGLFGFIDSTFLIFFVIAIPITILLYILKFSGNQLERLAHQEYISEVKPTELIWLVLTNPVFVFLYLYDRFCRFVKQLFLSKHIKNGTFFTLLMIAIYVISQNQFVSWQPFSVEAHFARNCIAVLPIFLVFNFLKDRNYFKPMEFWKQETIKFSLIVFGTTLLLFLTNTIVIQYDLSVFEQITFTQYAQEKVLLGLLFSFAFANFITNIIKLKTNTLFFKPHTNSIQTLTR